jgi:ABC-type multidrug transport system ATPase subunit
MLRVDNIRVSDGHIEVRKGISFSVEVGEIVALIGGNGAGKTTTLSTISGLLRPTAGSISWRGEAIPQPRWKPCRRWSGALPGRPANFSRPYRPRELDHRHGVAFL